VFEHEFGIHECESPSGQFLDLDVLIPYLSESLVLSEPCVQKARALSKLRSSAACFRSFLSANFGAGTFCGFFSVKRKLRGLSSPFYLSIPTLCQSHVTCVKPLKPFPFLSDITVKVFARLSRRRRNHRCCLAIADGSTSCGTLRRAAGLGRQSATPVCGRGIWLELAVSNHPGRIGGFEPL
jgi:hypothetical protein